MLRGRFTEDPIISALREHGAGIEDRQAVPKARNQRRDVLKLEGAVWRHDRVEGGTVASAGE